MPTADGCRDRRGRLLDRLRPAGPLLLADPLHLRYFAGLLVDPFSLGADYGGLLRVAPDGYATVYHDGRLPPAAVAGAHADDVVAVPWYDGVSPGRGPRRLALLDAAAQAGTGGRVHDAPTDPGARDLYRTVGALRRAKDPDELAAVAAALRAAEAGHAWARAHVRPGMTELDVYTGVSAACWAAAGRPVVVYGDFAVSPGPGRRGGPPTARVLAAGETLILDFSAVVDGYRGDTTNTLVVGGEPTADQQRLFALCVSALSAGENRLRAGAPGRAVYDAVRGVFAAANVADAFPHHAGHGLGLGHPEAPFFVRDADEILVAGDVVAIEPGLYVEGVGGVRVEHNYLVTDAGFERLSRHHLSLT